MASAIHKKRTGRGYKISEEIVVQEDMYEEEDDDLSRLRALSQPDAGAYGSAALSASIGDAPPGSALHKYAAALKHEAEVDELFAHHFPAMARGAQQRFLGARGSAFSPIQQPLPPGQYTHAPLPQQQTQFFQQSLAFESQPQPQPQPQPYVADFSRQQQNPMNPPFFSHQPANVRLSVATDFADDGRHRDAMDYTMASPQIMHAGINDGFVTGLGSRANSMPATVGLAPPPSGVPSGSGRGHSDPSSNSSSRQLSMSAGGPGAMSMPTAATHESSVTGLAAKTRSPPPVPGLSPNSQASHRAASVSTPGSQGDAVPYTRAISPLTNPLMARDTSIAGTVSVNEGRGPLGQAPTRTIPVIRHDSSSGSSNRMMSPFSPAKVVESNAWLSGAAVGMAGGDEVLHTSGPGMPFTVEDPVNSRYRLAEPSAPSPALTTRTTANVPWTTFYSDESSMAATSGPVTSASMLMQTCMPTAGVDGFAADAMLAPTTSYSATGGFCGAPMHLMGSETPADTWTGQADSHIGTPGGSDGDNWSDWVQFDH